MIQQRAENELRAAFRGLGAVTPASARPGKEFPIVDSATFDDMLRRGEIREGAPGTFYLYEESGSTRAVRPILGRIMFWIALIALPVGIIQFCGRFP